MIDTTKHLTEEKFERLYKMMKQFNLYNNINFEEALILLELILLSNKEENYFLFDKTIKDNIKNRFELSNSSMNKYLKNMNKQDLIRYYKNDKKRYIINLKGN